MKIDNTPTIALCMIAKDKGSIIARALDSTDGVFDMYCLQDTGSTDNTVEAFSEWCKTHGKDFRVSIKYVGKDYKSVEVDGKLLLGDFASARNDSFALAKGCDFALWMDTDDILVNPKELRALVSSMDKNGIGVALMTYVYAKGENGLNQVVQKRERLIDIRYDGEWQDRVHETYLVKAHVKGIDFEKTYLEHLRTPYEAISTGRRNNLIMTAQLKEDGLEKFSDKMLQSLAFDHFEHKEFANSTKYYKILYKRLSTRPPSDALFNTLSKVSQCYLGSNSIEKAIVWALRAKKLVPTLAEPYITLAQCYAATGNWEEAALYAKEVLRIGKPNTTAPINDYEYMVTPRAILQQYYLTKGDIDSAYKIADEIVNIIPNTQSKASALEIKLEKVRQEAVRGIISLSRYIQTNNQLDMMDRLKTAVPSELKDDPNIRAVLKELGEDYKRKRQSHLLRGPKSIVFYAGGHYEAWDGNSDKDKGIGGSEGMCIQMARELAVIGNKVFVYNECGNSDGLVIDGVTYMHHSRWDASIKCDVLVSLRRPDIFGQMIRAKKQYLWLHDTEYGSQLEPIHFYAPNKVIVLSEAHKDIIKSNHAIKDDSIFYMSRNALNKNAIEYADKNKGKRDPYKVVYASSYDRGLDVALSNWPKIKEAVPEATLDIYYGWNTYDALMGARRGTPHGKWMEEYKNSIVSMITKLAPLGVSEIGRVSQNELYKKFGEAGFWFYPTGFYEISCINAMTAQAMGAIPICSDYAALIETVGQWGVKARQGELADALIYKMQDIKETEKERKPMMKCARKEYDIISLAKEWDTMLNG